MPVTISCPMCEGEVEHLRHLFFECRYAQECLNLKGLNYDLSNVEYVSNWLLSALANNSSDEMVNCRRLSGVYGLLGINVFLRTKLCSQQ